MMLTPVDASTFGTMATLIAPDADAWGTFSEACPLSAGKMKLVGAPEHTDLSQVPVVFTAGHAACKHRFAVTSAFDAKEGCVTLAEPAGNWADGVAKCALLGVVEKVRVQLSYRGTSLTRKCKSPRTLQ